MQYREFEGPEIVMEVWGGGGHKNSRGKNQKSRRGVEKTFKVGMRQVAWPSHQTSSRSA